ncbi:MAG: TRAFs-binding domain-containing protein [Magnetococcus sp. YQC-9]
MRKCDYVAAQDVLDAARRKFPDNLVIKYLLARVYAERGVMHQQIELLDRAMKELAGLGFEQASSELKQEIFCLEGRLFKDTWRLLGGEMHGNELLQKAAKAYNRAFLESGSLNCFAAINAATLFFLFGNEGIGKRLAERVLALCAEKTGKERDDYWVPATMGEASLLLRLEQEAVDCYALARKGALKAGAMSALASMLRQLRLIERILPVPEAVIQSATPLRPAVFVGHMFDHPARPDARFPAAMAAPVADAIAEALERLQIGFGYSSLACGGDLLFVEALQKRPTHWCDIRLPFLEDDFMETSVAFAGERWVSRYELAKRRAIAAPESHFGCLTEEGYCGDPVLFSYASMYLEGMAVIKARELGVEPIMLAVIDPLSHSISGGALDNLTRWKRNGRAVEMISLRDFQPLQPTIPTPPARIPEETTLVAANPVVGESERMPLLGRGHRQIKGLLFADIKGFSGLVETRTPSFFVNFLNVVSRILYQKPFHPIGWNTWGDGLFMVFDSIEDAGHFAQHLKEGVRKTQWAEFGLPDNIRIRIGLHAGPVLPAPDPLQGRMNYFGQHISLAARIEPIADDNICMTEHAAALLACESGSDLSSEYLGLKELPKNGKEIRIYALRSK